EYGMRGGFWRIKKMLERLGISPTVTLNESVRGLPAGYRRVHRKRMGAARTQLRPGVHAQARRPAGNDQQIDGHHREVLRPAAARMVWSRIDADVRHARLPRRSRHRIYRRLGTRR